MDWVISTITILSMELTIRKHWAGWALALSNQCLWLVFIISTKHWGLLPLNIAMWIQSSRGLITWRRQARQAREQPSGV